jgi:hypothetical protein
LLLPRDDAGDIALLLGLIGAEPQQAAADHRGVEEGFANHAAPQRLAYHHQVGGPAAEAALLFRKWHTQPPQLGKLLPALGIETGLGAAQLAVALYGAVVADKLSDTVTEQMLLVTERKLHCWLPVRVPGHASKGSTTKQSGDTVLLPAKFA